MLHIICKRPRRDVDFVQSDSGTAVVHVAPRYGNEDFELFRRLALPIDDDIIDDNGQFTDAAGPSFAGQ